MREIPLSRCEYEFVTKCIKDGKRLDGRKLQDYRDITIAYKLDYGCCVVNMGKTKVMAQVAAEIDRPKESRPHEGNIGIFVEMSTMASPSFDPSKPGDLGVELQRILERAIILSKAVDFEELCIRVSEQVWNISLHIQILSHDGNILDCASIAAIAALSHFKRPDVTVTGKDVHIHTFEEKNPVSLTFNHQPFCVTFAFFDKGTQLVTDPTKLEENCCDGKLIMAVNKHREVCCTQMSGAIQVNSDRVLQCVNFSTKRVKELCELVKESIKNDGIAKAKDMKSSMTSSKSFKSVENDLNPKVHVMTSDSKLSVPLKEDSEPMETENTKKLVKSQKLSWVLKNAENTFTAVDNVSKNDELSEKTPGQPVDSDEEEETTITLQL